MQNYMLGGYVPAERVADLRKLFEENLERIVELARADGGEYDCRLSVQKIIEAVQDAELRGIGFLEASEVYSGPFGILN